jgi:porin
MKRSAMFCACFLAISTWACAALAEEPPAGEAPASGAPAEEAAAAEAKDGAEAEGTDYVEGTLTGDWGGLRTDWHKAGFDVDLGYKFDSLRNISGGTRRGGRPMGHLDIKLKGDMEKLVGWEGGTVYANYIADNGGKSNRDHVGSLTGVSNIEVATNTSRFLHLWAEQSINDGQLAVLAGLYPIDSEFQVVDSAGLFVQPPYGAAPDLALTRGPSIFNQSALGVRAKWQSESRKFYVMGAVLDGIPGEPDRPKGTHYKFNPGDGAMQILEFGLKPREKAPGAGKPPAEPGSNGVPPLPEAEDAGTEKYAVGYWRYTVKVNDQLDVDALGRAIRTKSHGWYALADRTLWQWEGGDLAGFVRVGATDGSSTSIDSFYNAGLRVKGLIPGRSEDVFGIARTVANISEKWRLNQAANSVNTVNEESVIEVTYRVQANKWLAVQPLIQEFRHPGALTRIPKATLLGFRLEMAL